MADLGFALLVFSVVLLGGAVGGWAAERHPAFFEWLARKVSR